jgi:hypothetical protein
MLVFKWKPFFACRQRGGFFLLAALFFCCSAQAQERLTPPQSQSDTLLIEYPGMLRLFTDTLWEGNSLQLLQVSWMDTTFQLERRYDSFVTEVPAPKLDNAHYELYREEAQWYAGGHCTPHANCYSFGLYQAFRQEGIDPNPLFNPTTFVPQESLEVLLATTFEKEHTLDATSLPELRQPIPVGSLLVFRGAEGAIIHAAYQSEEGLLSKNGNFEPRIYLRLDYLKRVYFETTTIDLYRLDADKLRDYLEGSIQPSGELAGR